MNAPYPLPQRDDGRLWTIALIASLLGNVAIFGVAAFASIEAAKFRKDLAAVTAAVAEENQESEAAVTISPDMFETVPAKPLTEIEKPPAAPAKPAQPDFTRTSEEHRGKRPDKPMFLGERDTEATSDRTPDPNAAELPAQKGIEPRDETDIETTESRYRDGPLEESAAAIRPGEMAPPSPPSPPTPPVTEPTPPQNVANPTPTPPVSEPASPQNAAAPTPAPPAEGKEIADQAAPEVPPMKELLEGPNPVEVPVAKPSPEKALPPAPPSDATEKADKATAEQKPPSPPAAKTDPGAPGQPGFRGYQRKTAIRGSISRTGRSALNVADSPLGRYQATISRAVEQEWQRNCVRHRDFITPGFLTVRFFVEASGKVKSVQFVGDMQTGEVQKGFTLNSIRDAEIPPMPKEIRGEYKDESLELIFNFYF